MLASAMGMKNGCVSPAPARKHRGALFIKNLGIKKLALYR
jgi:hypothetical protein